MPELHVPPLAQSQLGAGPPPQQLCAVAEQPWASTVALRINIKDTPTQSSPIVDKIKLIRRFIVFIGPPYVSEVCYRLSNYPAG